MLADVNAQVLEVLTKAARWKVGSERFPATPRVLQAEETAWQAAQRWQKIDSTSLEMGDKIP